MKVKEKPAVFVTSDGEEFETLKQAEAHQLLVDAQAEFDRARRVLLSVLGNDSVTADGQPYEHKWRTYWKVYTPIDSVPCMRQFQISGYEELQLIDDSVAVMFEIRDRSQNHIESKTALRIGDLYARKENAEAVLRLAKQQFAQRLLEELADDAIERPT